MSKETNRFTWEGTLIEQVTAWLDEEAKSKARKKYVEDSRQLFLDI